MKIGYVLRYWPTLSETFVVREIAALARRGAEIEIVAIGRRRDPCRGEALPGVRVHRPPRGRGAWRLAPEIWQGLHTARARGVHPGRFPVRPKDAARILWLTRLAAARGWERLHAHFAGEAAIWALAAAEGVGIPASVTVHASDLFRPHPALASVLRQARPVITVCRHHQRWIARHHGIRAAVVRCGVEPDRYRRSRPADAPMRWICVARDVPKKGLDDLVAAITAIGGTLRLVSDAVRLGGPGVLAGPLAADRVPEALARSTGFVLPCRVVPDGDRDGIPVALMEAMASGLPVATTAVSGIPELVDAEVGWWLPLGDPSSMARVLREIQRAPDERARRGSAARERIRAGGWTVARQAEELLGHWTDFVAP